MVSEEIVVATTYAPRKHQAYLHAKLKRFNVIVSHRRFGKTVFAVNEMIDQAMRCKAANPQLAYLSPTYSQSEKVAWEMVKQFTKNIPGVVFNETKLTCTIPRPDRGDRIKIMLLGADNYDSLRGIYLDGCILDEYAIMGPEVWGKVIRPALSDRKGWALFISTPRGTDHFYDMYQLALRNPTGEWYGALFRASQTGIIPPSELDAMRAEMSEDEYEQEMECNFAAALTGAYWGRQMSEAEKMGRIARVPHDPALTVDTFWDLGVGDTTAIWFTQVVALEVRIIDYLEMSGQGLEYFAKKLKEDGREKYDYGDHNWPHDGGSRDLSTGVERSTTMRGLLKKNVIVHPKYNVDDSIQAARRLLSRCWFDAEKTHRGRECLKNYQKKWDAKNRLWSDGPLHNWASHGADGFRLLAMSLRPGLDRRTKDLPRHSVQDYDIFNLGGR